MEKQKVIVYVDGFNFYYGLKAISSMDSRWKKFYWLNVVSFFEKMMNDKQELVEVNYFSARSHDVASSKRQDLFFSIKKRSFEENLIVKGMKKVVLLLIVSLALFPFDMVTAQVTKRDDVYFKDRTILQSVNRYENDVLSSRTFVLTAQDSKYSRIISTLVVRYDNSVDEMYSFLIGLNNFLTKYGDDDNVSLDVEGNIVSRYKIGLRKGVLIQDYKKEGLVDLSDKVVKDLLKNFLKYCKKNNIEP
jgi:hypothetical protein